MTAEEIIKNEYQRMVTSMSKIEIYEVLLGKVRSL